MTALEKLLATKKVEEAGLKAAGLEGQTATQGLTWAGLLKRPEVTMGAVLRAVAGEITNMPELAAMVEQDGQEAIARAVAHNEARAVETGIKFAGYLDQQRKSIAKLKAAESVAIPDWLEYHTISGLSREMQEKLERVRPGTIGQASRIPGVTPAALSLVHVSIRVQGAKRGEAAKAN